MVTGGDRTVTSHRWPLTDSASGLTRRRGRRFTVQAAAAASGSVPVALRLASCPPVTVPVPRTLLQVVTQVEVFRVSGFQFFLLSLFIIMTVRYPTGTDDVGSTKLIGQNLSLCALPLAIVKLHVFFVYFIHEFDLLSFGLLLLFGTVSALIFLWGNKAILEAVNDLKEKLEENNSNRWDAISTGTAISDGKAACLWVR
jgi:hypothetical protein